MFPSISKEVGLEQCEMHLNKRIDPLFSTDCILEVIDIAVSHNLTEFEGKMYKQIKGTAMGPNNTCVYAGVAMDFIDVLVNEGTGILYTDLFSRLVLGMIFMFYGCMV